MINRLQLTKQQHCLVDCVDSECWRLSESTNRHSRRTLHCTALPGQRPADSRDEWSGVESSKYSTVLYSAVLCCAMHCSGCAIARLLCAEPNRKIGSRHRVAVEYIRSGTPASPIFDTYFTQNFNNFLASDFRESRARAAPFAPRTVLCCTLLCCTEYCAQVRSAVCVSISLNEWRVQRSFFSFMAPTVFHSSD